MISHYITNNKHISCFNPGHYTITVPHLPVFGVRWLFLLWHQTEFSCSIEWAVSQQVHTVCSFCRASQAQITNRLPSMSAGCDRTNNAQHPCISASGQSTVRREDKTKEDKRYKQMIAQASLVLFPVSKTTFYLNNNPLVIFSVVFLLGGSREKAERWSKGDLSGSLGIQIHLLKLPVLLKMICFFS